MVNDNGIDMKGFMDRIDELRIKSGYDGTPLNYQEFSHKANISPQAITNYKNGKRTPSVEILNSIANAYGVSTDWLLGRQTCPDATIHEVEIARYLNITDGAVRKLSEIGHSNNGASLLNVLFDSNYTEGFFSLLSEAVKSAYIQNHIPELEEFKDMETLVAKSEMEEEKRSEFLLKYEKQQYSHWGMVLDWQMRDAANTLRKCVDLIANAGSAAGYDEP